MKTMKRILSLPLILVLFVAVSVLACQPRTVSSAGAGLAPDFTLNDLDGKPFRFSSTRGKVVILDFWATW
ncbi:MAG: peroxiredoxin family protein, partial [Candidatus Omnitrophota bacterium]